MKQNTINKGRKLWSTQNAGYFKHFFLLTLLQHYALWIISEYLPFKEDILKSSKDVMSFFGTGLQMQMLQNVTKEILF